MAGRPSIFSPKDGGPVRVAAMTKAGTAAFERARRKLAKLATWDVSSVTDADVTEALSRGWAETAKYLKSK